MKILLGNNTLSLLAGSETWTYTLATVLKKMGHEVRCYAPYLGIISDKLEQNGIKCFDNLAVQVRPFSFVFEEKIDHNYDVIIANHNHVVDYLRAIFPATPIISTIHGIIHFMDDEQGNKVIAPEHPAINAGVNQFIAVSEEVRDILLKDYNIDSLIIRNFFDLENFNVKKKINAKPQQFLINSNYQLNHDPEVELIREVAKHYGARLAAVGVNFSQTFETIKAIEDADIVVGMGRSVLEGVAAGRLGIVHGRWGTGGVVCEENIDKLRQFNFSGRNSKGKLFTKNDLIADIDNYYNQETIDWGHQYITREHNAVLAADQYLAIARELTGQIINKPKEAPLRPYRRAKDVARAAQN
jgi:hypothetical protein